MRAATWPRPDPLAERLLAIDPRSAAFTHRRVADLARLLRAPDLLVVNDAATVPASLFGTTLVGATVEIRLASFVEPTRWRAVLFGAGDWHTPTERRPPPPRVAPGDALVIAHDFRATVEAVDDASPRLVVLRFTGDAAFVWRSLYRHGRPVQYAHVARPLEIWHVQTPFSARPWAVEMPSAGRPLAWSLMRELQRAGVGLRSITHAAGLSSTGDAALDARLPFPERFDVPAATVAAVHASHAGGGRVIAVGTTVVRALEGCAALHGGELVAGEGSTDLRIGAAFRRRVVDGLLTGMHEAGTSHRELAQAFAPEPLLAASWADAERRGYLGHEFGDATLIAPGVSDRRTAVA